MHRNAKRKGASTDSDSKCKEGLPASCCLCCWMLLFNFCVCVVRSLSLDWLDGWFVCLWVPGECRHGFMRCSSGHAHNSFGWCAADLNKWMMGREAMCMRGTWDRVQATHSNIAGAKEPHRTKHYTCLFVLFVLFVFVCVWLLNTAFATAATHSCRHRRKHITRGKAKRWGCLFWLASVFSSWAYDGLQNISSAWHERLSLCHVTSVVPMYLLCSCVCRLFGRCLGIVCLCVCLFVGLVWSVCLFVCWLLVWLVGWLVGFRLVVCVLVSFV